MIKAYLAVSAIIGTALGPMSPGSAYVLLHHYMGDVDGNVGAWGFARGGMGAITQALAAVARAPRAARSAPAQASSASSSENGRATGVVLDGGEEIAAAPRRLQHGREAHLPRLASRRRTCPSRS